MLDIKFIRDNRDLIESAARKKHLPFDVGALLEADKKRLDLLSKVETLRAEQNKTSEKVAGTNDPAVRETFINQMRTLKEDLKRKEDELKPVLQEWQKLMLSVPNVPDMSVPEGKDENENLEIRTHGKKPQFSFTPKDHVELLESLDMADFERGTKTAGFRGYFLKNEGALLSFAIWQYTINHLVKKGYSPMIVPSLVTREVLLGSGYLPQGEEDLYKTQDGSYLAGTGEVSTMAYYMGETLLKKDLPKKFLSFSSCFRREAGAHGKDVKGAVRVHEFFKVEQVILCEASHETSVILHEELTKNSEEILQGLGLAYRVTLICGGDLGLGQVKKYDLEAWVPSQGKYRETHSASYFHDFQTRRLNIRYRDDDGKLKFAHSLNNTAIATPRVLVALIEQYQNKDGSITVPEALRLYMGKDVIQKN